MIYRKDAESIKTHSIFCTTAREDSLGAESDMPA
jgi:hypothetical protein